MGTNDIAKMAESIGTTTAALRNCAQTLRQAEQDFNKAGNPNMAIICSTRAAEAESTVKEVEDGLDSE